MNSQGQFSAISYDAQFDSLPDQLGKAYPRELADINGDGMAYIVGFAANVVWTAEATGNGYFATA